MNLKLDRLFTLVCCLVAASLPGCDNSPDGGSEEISYDTGGQSVATGGSLAEARANFRTNIVRQIRAGYPTPEPPASLFRLVKYTSPAGELDAYVTPDPGDDVKRPAIIWIFGGFDNSIGETAWEEATPDNDQSARPFRDAGLVMMYPSFRGGNQNPGSIETFYGEVDDVLSAADFLSQQPYVDPNRIYLGGHSTGGTLALLVAAASDRFRAVFSFGPVGKIVGYGVDDYGFDINSRPEFELRDPILWLEAIQSPTFVIEGEYGNIDSLREMAQATRNPKLSFLPVPGADHFSVLAPVTRLLANKVSPAAGSEPNLMIAPEEINAAVSP